jgi:dihydroorotate dehydrogenase
LINPKADHGNKEQQREPKKTLQLTSLLELQIGINKENSSNQSINQLSKKINNMAIVFFTYNFSPKSPPSIPLVD